MKAKIIVTLVACMTVLGVALIACGGESPSGTPEEQLERYNAAYDQITENDTLNNQDELTYDKICELMGDKGEWVAFDEETDEWIPLNGTPKSGEEAALRYSVEGVDGSILVLWAEDTDYREEGLSSISNSF